MKKFIVLAALSVVLVLPAFAEACHRTRALFVQRERVLLRGSCGPARQIFRSRAVIRGCATVEVIQPAPKKAETKK